MLRTGFVPIGQGADIDVRSKRDVQPEVLSQGAGVQLIVENRHVAVALVRD